MRAGAVLRPRFVDALQEAVGITVRPPAAAPTAPRASATHSPVRPRPSPAIMGVGIAMLVIAVIGIALMAQRLNAPLPTPSATIAASSDQCAASSG